MPFIAITFMQAQVSLVKEINLGSASSMPTYPKNRIAFGGKLLFAADNGADGVELWESDGSSAGTVLLSDLRAGALDSNPNGFHLFNSKIYFSAAGVQDKYNIFSTDGTSISSYPAIRYGTGSASPRLFTTFGNLLVFSARPSAFNQSLPFYGEEILGFNGSAWSGGGDQIMIKDINPMGNSSTPENYTLLNNMLFFSATDDGTNGRELWVTNGLNSVTNLFLDINPGSPSSAPEHLIAFNNKIYFSADNGTNGTELWVTDGTVGGTSMVLDLYAGATGSDPENLTVFNNALYFSANNPTLGREIFKMTTSETVTSLKNIAPGSGNSNPSTLFVFNGKLYFSADDGTNGVELWSSTGFSSTTNILKDINPIGDGVPSNFTAYNGKLYFSADNEAQGMELWVTDGTNAGTMMVADIRLGFTSSNPKDLIVANNILFFSADDGSTGRELWKYQDPSLSLNNFELENSISLFPNPTNSGFSIETKYPINKIDVYDIQGKTVKSFKEKLDFYDVEDLTSGLYFVNIKTDNSTITKKLIKE